MLAAKVFLLSPAELGVLISLKHTTEIRWDHLIPADFLLFPAFKIAKGV